jgi:hypothetical protein
MMTFREDLMTHSSIVTNFPSLTHLPVMVPVENTHWSKVIIRGSALLVIPSDFTNGKILIYFEGNKAGSRDMVRFADKCFNAACRGLIGFPTMTMAIIPPGDLIEVGSYDIQRKVVAITNPEPLLAWCGWKQIDPEELISTQ